jgi:geranylgeranyl diphosphate synthase, type I
MPDNLVSLKSDVDLDINAFLDEQLRHYETITKNERLVDLLAHIKAVSAGGKRIRPFLVYSLYRHSNQGATSTDIMPLLLAVELFHVFCLIHDDIMDEAAVRHGVATAHAYAKETFYPTHPRAAENQSILIGDILFNSVFKLLHEFATNNTHGSKIISLFHDLVDEVCIGQMLDIDLTTQSSATIAAITEKNRLKTAWYSIVRPLHLGLVVAEREDLLPFATEFGEQIGLLYQTQDDLLDVIGDMSKTKKPRFQDVAQNQHTLLRAFIEEQTTEYSDKLQQFLGKPVTETGTSELEAIFTNSGAIEYAKKCIADYEEKTAHLIETKLTNDTDKEFFLGIMNLITKRTQ